LSYPLNKSRINSYKWCKTDFFIKYVLNLRSEKIQQAVGGINIHLLLYHFYDVVDFNELKKRRHNDLETYIYDTMYSIVPDEYRPDFRERYDEVITNFASIETARIMEYKKNHIMRKKYYFPLMREIRLEDKENNMFGTLDRVDKLHPKFRYEKRKYYLVVIDYKTGKAKELTTPNRRELTVYMKLLSKATGIPVDRILGQILWLGKGGPSVSYFTYSRRTDNALQKVINEIREVMKDPKPEYFLPRFYEKKCRFCSSKPICHNIFKYDDDGNVVFCDF